MFKTFDKYRFIHITINWYLHLYISVPNKKYETAPKTCATQQYFYTTTTKLI